MIYVRMRLFLNAISETFIKNSIALNLHNEPSLFKFDNNVLALCSRRYDDVDDDFFT